MKKILTIVLLFLVIALGVALYFSFNKKQPAATTTTPPAAVIYTNNDFSFSFSLPGSWRGYSIVTDKWEGYSLSSAADGQKITERGPLISIRHPEWTPQTPRQDMPIMIFTLKQWGDLQQDKFHIGASPIGPSELGRNNKYVFALPARYNFAFPTGFEEVDSIIKSSPLRAF